jgi:predicted amidophosphoribosyltransferase
MPIHIRGQLGAQIHAKTCDECGWSGDVKRNTGYCPECDAPITDHTKKTREPYFCWGGHPITKTTEKCAICGKPFDNSRYRRNRQIRVATLDPRRWSGSAAPHDIVAGFWNGVDVLAAERKMKEVK